MPRVRDELGHELDATFFVERDARGLAIVVESRGGTRGSSDARNADYNQGLELLLGRLGTSKAVLVDAVLDSARTAARFFWLTGVGCSRSDCPHVQMCTVPIRAARHLQLRALDRRAPRPGRR